MPLSDYAEIAAKEGWELEAVEHTASYAQANAQANDGYFILSSGVSRAFAEALAEVIRERHPEACELEIQQSDLPLKGEVTYVLTGRLMSEEEFKAHQERRQKIAELAAWVPEKGDFTIHLVDEDLAFDVYWEVCKRRPALFDTRPDGYVIRPDTQGLVM